MPATISVNFASQAVANAGTSTNTSINPATLAGVLANAGGTGSGYVTIAGAQTITGAKTFSAAIQANSIINVANGQSYNIGGVGRLYGATQDSYANIRVCQNLSTTLQDGMYINYNSTGGTAAHCRIFANSTIQRMIVRADTGRVGIGTDNPTATLDVNGEIRSDFFNAGGATASIGRATLKQGNSTNAGYVEWFKGDGVTRMGYIGFNNTDLNIVCENSTVLLASAAGGFRCTGDITAFFSDERLKTFEGKISNALDKVNALNGYYYKENEKAKSLGYNNEDIQVGVSAQEVEKVLPEIVTLAPIDTDTDEDGNKVSKSGENIKTVKYEKLIPLLIEAVKELKTKVDQLEKK